jgi:hypothetical protein
MLCRKMPRKESCSVHERQSVSIKPSSQFAQQALSEVEAGPGPASDESTAAMRTD